MTEAMKPCPFCGGAGWVDFTDVGRPTYAVTCCGCAATGGWSKISEADAIFRWNMRTEPMDGRWKKLGPTPEEDDL